MRSVLLCLAFAIALGQQPKLPKEAYPGQREHKEPPKGWFCSPQAKDKAHVCQCKRMAVKTKDDPDCCDAVPAEDSACAVWCHQQFCRCPVQCVAGGHHE